MGFNRFEVEGNAPDALEVAYGRFEGEAIPAIRRICRSQQILGNEDEYQYLLNFIALLAVRNPRSRRAMTNARIRSAQS